MPSVYPEVGFNTSGSALPLNTSEPGADRGPQGASPLGVVDATGSLAQPGNPTLDSKQAPRLT
jgi:hypothetical protein